MQHRVAIGVVAIVLVIVIASIITGYWFEWTGFDGYNQVTIAHTVSGPSAGTVIRSEVYQPGKTLWDWLNLLGALAIPAVVGLGAAWYTAQQGKVSDRENIDNQRETALQAYIDKISELLLEKDLRKSGEDDEVRKIARVRTLTVLPRLDGRRKGSVLQFLYESDLINKDKPIIHLEDADLSEAELIVADLSGADLSKAHLFKANLNSANLLEANLTKANLFRASLLEANLHGASLLDAELRGAKLHGANLGEADLSEADLSGGFDLGPTGLYWDEPIWRVTDLNEADLSKANLSGADLSEANMRGAIVTTEQLDKARSLKGATMPDGSKQA